VTLKVLVFPRATFPKFKLEALTVRSDVAAVAVPLRETVFAVLERLLTTATWPLSAPAVFGVKTTLNEACAPASITTGNEAPVIVTPAAVALACVRVRLEPPPFFTVTDWEAVLPTGTVPKLRDAGATEIEAGAAVLWLFVAVFAEPVKPVHPEVERVAKIRSARKATDEAFFQVESVCVAIFPAALNRSIAVVFCMNAILIRGGGGTYCSAGQLKGRRWIREVQGGTCTDAQVRKIPAGCPCAELGCPPITARLFLVPIYGTLAETSAE